MPRVPFIPQVGLQQAGSVGFSAGPRVVPFDNPTGQQMQQLGEVIAQTGGQVSRLGQTIQERVDRGAITSASALLQEEATREQQSYGKLLGLDAVSAREASLKRLADRRAKLESALSNDRQRLEFKLQADRTMLEHEMAVDSHYEKQARTYEMQASSARAEGAIDAYVSSFLSGQNEAAAGHEETLESEVRHSAQIAGVAPEAIGGMVRDQKSRMHAGVVDKLLEDGGSSSMAAEYLAHAKKLGQISAKDDERLTALVGRATVRDESKKVADFVTSKTLDPAKQREILDTLSQQGLRTEVFDEALQRLRADNAERFTNQKRAEKETLDEASAWMTENRGRPLSEMPAALQQAIATNGVASEVRALQESEGQRITDGIGHSIINRAIVDPSFLRGQQWEVVARDTWAHLTPQDQEKLAKLHAAANQKADAKQIPGGDIDRTVRLWMIEKGFYPDPRKSDDPPTKEQTYRLDMMLDRMGRRFQGKDVSDYAVVDKALSEAMGTVLQVGGRSLPRDATTPAEFEAGSYQTPYGTMDVNRIPPDAWARYADEIRRENAVINRANLSLPPGMKPEPMVESSDNEIARRYRRELWQREQAQKAAQAAADAKRAEEVRTKGRYSGRMQDTFGSPWGR